MKILIPLAILAFTLLQIGGALEIGADYMIQRKGDPVPRVDILGTLKHQWPAYSCYSASLMFCLWFLVECVRPVLRRNHPQSPGRNDRTHPPAFAR